MGKKEKLLKIISITIINPSVGFSGPQHLKWGALNLNQSWSLFTATCRLTAFHLMVQMALVIFFSSFERLCCSCFIFFFISQTGNCAQKQKLYSANSRWVRWGLLSLTHESSWSGHGLLEWKILDCARTWWKLSIASSTKRRITAFPLRGWMLNWAPTWAEPF